MTLNPLKFNLGVVTNGYVMMSMKVKLMLSCNLQVITAPTKSLNTFKYTQNSGI